MDTTDLEALVDELSGNIDDLEEALAPLLKSGLTQSTSKLPLLDKAKAYVFATYAIESMLISYVRLNGVDGKSHPVFQEMARVREYNGKIKAAETGGAKRNTTLDREAANRMIKHGLAGNDKYDLERAQRAAAEKVGAKRRLEEYQVGTHTRFDGAVKRIKASEEAQEGVDAGQSTREATGDEGTAAATTSPSDKKSKKKSKKHREHKLEKLFAEPRPNEREGGAGFEGMEHAGEAEVEISMGNESMASSNAASSAGGNETTPRKNTNSRRKKNAEKMENGRAGAMK